MSSVLTAPEEEYCPNCGSWVVYLNFNYEVGWCTDCTQDTFPQPRCIHCGTVLENTHRTTCRTCRQELWLERHADELEYLVVCKGYTVAQAKVQIAKMIRPICQHCGKPIVGAKDGALFHRSKPKCHQAYGRYKKLLKQGLTPLDALARIRE